VGSAVLGGASVAHASGVPPWDGARPSAPPEVDVAGADVLTTPRMKTHESIVRANGIAHFVVTFGESDEARKTIVCAHGFLDHAFGFEPLARHLVPRGFKLVAFDFRGHGRSGWVPLGGYYHFADYVADMDELLPQIAPPRPHLLGHSMGGTAAGLFAGARPDAIDGLILLEGLGPPESALDEAPRRMRAFLDEVKKVRARGLDYAGRPVRSVAEALERMRRVHPDLGDDPGLFLAEKATRELADGTRVFRYDPLHRSTSPMPYRFDHHATLLREVTAETLIVHGSRGYRHPEDEERRREATLRSSRRVVIEGAGHMLHWTHAREVADAIEAHLEKGARESP
jgi:pimeloyl-ACP methyl ester carboxylesterase